MKDLRYLALFVLMALLVACDLTTAKAPPLVVSLPKATQSPLTVVIERPVMSARDYVEPNLYIDRQLPNEVVGSFYAVSVKFPGVAKGIKKIIAVRYPKVGWAAKFDPGVIYVNLGITHCKTKTAWCVKGKIDHARSLAYQYGRAIFAQWQAAKDRRAVAWRDGQRFAAWLATGVR